MLPTFSVKKPYTIIVAVVIVLILGGVSAAKMQTSLIPSLDLPYVAVITTDQGASPEEVEASVTGTVESALATTSGVDVIESVSAENMSVVAIQFVEGTDMNSVMLEMRETLDLYTDYLPEDAGTPMLMKLDMNAMPVAVLTADMSGADRSAISTYVEDKVVGAYESVDGVASVSTSGIVTPQANVIISQEKLDRANSRIENVMAYAPLFSGTTDASSMTSEQMMALMSGDTSSLSMTGSLASETEANDGVITRDMITQLLKADNFSYPNGYVTEDGVDYLVRTGDAYTDPDALSDMLLVSVPEANIDIRLGDVADIAVVDDSDSSYTKVDGNDAVVLTMQKQSESSTSEVSHKIAQKTEELQEDDSQLHITTLMDQGEYIDIVVDSVTSNLLIGAILAIIVLLLFLRSWKLTGVIALSIPLSLVVALILMYFSGITLNLLSLSGLALGVGMLVDNSIVVIENIYRTRQEGGDVKAAAIAGAKQVAGAIIASTITTCAVFLPFAFATGITKQLFVDLALTVCYSLVGSLIVALTFVPMMCSGALKNTREKPHRIFDAVRERYTKLLSFCLRHKVVPILVVVVIFGACIGAVTQMGTQFFPETDSSQITTTVTLDQDSTFEERCESLDEIIAAIGGIEGVDRCGATMSDAGSTSTMDMSMLMGGAGNTVSVYAVLDEKRPATSIEIARTIDETCAGLGYITKTGGGSMDVSQLTGSGVQVVVYGDDLDKLREVSADLASQIAALDGTSEVSDGYNQPSPEMRITVDKDAAIAHGLTVMQVYSAVNATLATPKSTTTVSDADTDYPVVVSTDTDIDPTRGDIEAIKLTDATTGDEVPLTDIASIEYADGYVSIAHDGQQRCVTISADIADGYNIGKVGDQVNDIVDSYSFDKGYSAEVAGENETITKAMNDLMLVMILAIILVYLVMVAQFQSLRFPLIIMITLPLAYTGGILALLICGMPLSVVSVVGFVLLTGIVVNNGIVFVDYTNKMREAGMTKHDALIKAGRDRLRPIIMTALTTIIAMLAMAFAVGESSEMSQPMAIVVIGGLIYATCLTLIIVPVLYDAMGGKDKKDEDFEPIPDEQLPSRARFDAIEVD